ncbi:MAG: hypothetical protein R3330_13875, partial [Saprospiraceae bacterium]|nr:hypothetical protein [Saprospiraceae bacterium]
MMCLDPDAVSHELMFFLSDTDTAGEKGMYVCTDSNPNNVITDKASAFGKVLAKLSMNQEVTVMDSDELDKNKPFVKVRIETDGKVIEGWVRRSVLCEKKTEIKGTEPAESTHSGIGPTATKGSVGMTPPEFNPPGEEDPEDTNDDQRNTISNGRGFNAQPTLLICADDHPLRLQVVDALLHDFRTFFDVNDASVLMPAGSAYRSDLADVLHYQDMKDLGGQFEALLCSSAQFMYTIMLFEPDGGPAPASIATAINACQRATKLLSNDFCVIRLGEICSKLNDPTLLTTFSYDNGAVGEPLVLTAMDQGVVVGRPWWPYVVVPVVTVPTVLLLTGDDTPVDPCANDRPPVITTQAVPYSSVCFTQDGFQTWLDMHGGAQASDESSAMWSHNFTGTPACGMS